MSGIPSSNLLDEAFGLIETQTIQWMPYSQRTLNDVRQWVTTYAAPQDIEASVQAVDRQTYVDLGLDFQKDYVQVYACIDSTDLDRDVTGDRFILPDGRVYQIESELSWFMMDGWTGSLCVKVDKP
ncbi:head protein [Burkholderia phage Bm1]